MANRAFHFSLKHAALAALAALGLCQASGSAEAGTRVVRAEGRAAIAGNDIAGARRSALAEALYEAAGQVRSRVRGGSHLSTYGVLTEESSVAVEAQLKGYQVTSERREGSRYMVAIEALADSDDDSCNSGKKIDLDVRAIAIRVAPGLPGSVKTIASESISRGVASLASNPTFRAVDNRDVPAPHGGEAGARIDYMSLMTGALPSQAGYTISGTMAVERQRNDTLVTNSTDISATLTLNLRDNYSNTAVQTITHAVRVPVRSRIWGSEVDFGTPGSVDLSPVWQESLRDLERILGCQPLRAKVLAVEGQTVTLSVGSENGIKAGDYFLVELPGKKGRVWQLLNIQNTTPNHAIARLMKPSPSIPVNSLAVLMQ